MVSLADRAGFTGKEAGERGVSPEDRHGPSETPSLGGGAGDTCTLQGSCLDTNSTTVYNRDGWGGGSPCREGEGEMWVRRASAQEETE